MCMVNDVIHELTWSPNQIFVVDEYVRGRIWADIGGGRRERR